MCLAGLSGVSQRCTQPYLEIGGNTGGAAESLREISNHSTAEKHQEPRGLRRFCLVF